MKTGNETQHLFTDAQMRDFILNGYVRVDTGLPPAAIEDLYREVHGLIEQRKFRDEFFLHTPAVKKVFDSPAVRGSLSSILGPSYRMYSHRHCHHMPPQPADATPGWHQMDYYLFHKDTKTPSHHRCRQVMSIFFPHDCEPNRGPTGLIPGSQYFTRTTTAYCHDSMQGAAPAGTLHFVHYDMWHGGTCNYTDKDRFLLKFVFERIDEPTEPAWNCRDTTWKPVKSGPSGQQLNDLWECMWNWNCGKPSFAPGGDASLSGHRPKVQDIPRLVTALRDEDENVSLQSAYALARLGEPAVAPLLDKLIEESAAGPDENLNGRKWGKGGDGGKPFQLYYSSYALAAIGAPAASGLAKLLQHPNWWVRASAADTLREMGRPGAAAASALAQALRDENENVRSIAAEALGTSAPASDIVIRALVERLSDPSEGVRLHAVGALLRIRPTPDYAVPALIKLLQDPARYVRGHAAATLERIGSNEARKAVTEFLSTRPDEVCLPA